MSNLPVGKMIVGLDIGTSKVVAIVGEQNDEGDIEIITSSSDAALVDIDVMDLTPKSSLVPDAIDTSRSSHSYVAATILSDSGELSSSPRIRKVYDENIHHRFISQNTPNSPKFPNVSSKSNINNFFFVKHIIPR